MTRSEIKLNKDLGRISEELMAVQPAISNEVTFILIDTANKIRNDIIHRMMRSPKRGRLYKKGKRGGIKHRASAPWQYPAVDTGQLVRSIVFEAKRMRIEIGAEAGAPYAKYLESGTNKMQPRPFLQRSADRFTRHGQLDARVAEALGRVIGKTLR